MKILLYGASVFILLMSSCKDDSVSSPSTGTISGTVRDDSSRLVSGVTISTLPPTASVTSGSDGSYTIPNVKANDYVINAFKSGYADASASIAVAAGRVTTADLVLKNGPPNLAPLTPSALSPADNDTVPKADIISLTWSCSDPENDALKYDVLFGTVQSLTSANIIAENHLTKVTNRSGLDTGVIYFWQVIAKDTKGHTTKGPVWRFRVSVIEFALSLENDSNYAETAHTADLHLNGSSYTIEAWVYYSFVPSSWWAIIGKENTDNSFDYVLMADATNVFRFQSRSIDCRIYGTTHIEAKKWYHVAAVQDVSQGTVSLFVNGTLEASKALIGSESDIPVPLRLGSRINDLTGGYPLEVMKGLIDEVKLWNVARSQSEIRESMSKPLAGNESGLVAYWRFNEGKEASSEDLSGNGHRVVFMNHATWKRSNTPVK